MTEQTKEEVKSQESKKDKSALERLKEKEAQLKARIQLLENKEKESLRKKENRVKFLMGSFLLSKITSEKEAFSDLFKDFQNYLTRERDQITVKDFFNID